MKTSLRSIILWKDVLNEMTFILKEYLKIRYLHIRGHAVGINKIGLDLQEIQKIFVEYLKET